MPIVMETPEQLQKTQATAAAAALEPRFGVELPSKGKLGYPSRLEFRFLKIRELKALSLASQSEETFWNQLVDTVQSCLVTSDFSVRELAVQDFVAVVVGLRANSLGPVLELLVTCPHCGQPFPVSINLSDLKVKEIPEDFSEPGKVGEYEVWVPRVKDVNLLKVESEIDLARIALRMEPEMFEEQPAKLARDVMDWLAKSDFGYDLTQNIICTKCSKEVIFVVPIREFFR